jgi:hypothetical protein
VKLKLFRRSFPLIRRFPGGRRHRVCTNFNKDIKSQVCYAKVKAGADRSPAGLLPCCLQLRRLGPALPVLLPVIGTQRVSGLACHQKTPTSYLLSSRAAIRSWRLSFCSIFSTCIFPMAAFTSCGAQLSDGAALMPTCSMDSPRCHTAGHASTSRRPLSAAPASSATVEVARVSHAS